MVLILISHHVLGRQPQPKTPSALGKQWQEWADENYARPGGHKRAMDRLDDNYQPYDPSSPHWEFIKQRKLKEEKAAAEKAAADKKE